MSLKTEVSLSPPRKRGPNYKLDSRLRGNDRRIWSIRTRLLIGYAVAILLSMVVISAFLYLQVKRDLVNTMKVFLRTEFASTLQLIETAAEDPGGMSNFLSRQTLLGKSPYKLNYALFDKAGHVIARTESFSEDTESLLSFQNAAQDEPFERTEQIAPGKTIHLITQSFKNRAGTLFFLQFGLDESGIGGTLSSLAGAVFIAIPVILWLAVVGGYFLTRRLLSPIEKLSKAAREITIINLDKELPIAGTGDELDELAVTFNEVFTRLRDSYQRIIRFTADVSHELRLPITAIKGQAEVVLSRERGLEEYRKVLADIIEEFNRLSRMVNQLLALSRSDSGEEALEYEQVDLKDLLAKLVDFYQPLAEEKQIALSFDVSDVIPAKAGIQLDPRLRGGDKSLSIRADRIKLQELFSNLLENAVKYTHPSGSVKVQLKNDGGNLFVRIADTGVGIAKSEQSKIFERFYRVDKSRSRDQGGVGLGLSIADAIARAHRASISVESELGKGSAFIVIFPK